MVRENTFRRRVMSGLTPAAPQTTRDLRHLTAGQGRMTEDGGPERQRVPFARRADASQSSSVRAQTPINFEIIMKLPTRISLLVFNLLLALLFANCSNGDAIESHTMLPTAYATPYVVPPTSTPSLDTEISSLLTRYGWTIKQQISIHTETLPKNLQHYPGDFPYVIYWAYNNEFNKDIGFDLVPYLGLTVQASIYSLNEPLPEEFYPYTEAFATIVISDNKIIGAWIDRGRHYGFACSLNRGNFDEIVNQEWSEWLISSGVVDLSNELDRELSKKTPEEIIEIYYTAMNEGDYQLFYAVQSRRNIAVDLFRNKDELALFNHQDDPANRRWMDNIESAHLVNIEELGSANNCLPVYAASVNFQFVDPRLPTIPEGESLRFVVLNEEIEGLGWRIEEVNTAPGVSDRFCPP